MTDVREDILARLLEIVTAVPGIRSTQRNNIDIVELELPAALLFDGDEETHVTDITSGRPGTRAYLPEMTPTISIVQQADAVGSEMTAFRSQLVKLVLNDTELNGLAGSNGGIRYLGCSTNFGWGRFMHGVVDVNFLFKYPLKIQEL